jgi:hypothetical protein
VTFSVGRVISGTFEEQDLVNDDRLRACHPLEREGGCANVGRMIYDVMARRMNIFHLVALGGKSPAQTAFTWPTQSGIYSGVVYGYKKSYRALSISGSVVLGGGGGDCTRSALQQQGMGMQKQNPPFGQGMQPPLSLSASPVS